MTKALKERISDLLVIYLHERENKIFVRAEFADIEYDDDNPCQTCGYSNANYTTVINAYDENGRILVFYLDGNPLTILAKLFSIEDRLIINKRCANR